MDARRSPEGIGEGHGADELCDLAVDGRSPGPAAPGLPVPECAEALPVPANHGLGANHIERRAPPRPPLREPYPEESIEGAKPRTLRAATEQGELLSERQVLKNEVRAGSQRSAQSAPQSEYEVHCRSASPPCRPTSSVSDRVLSNDRCATLGGI